MDCKTAKEKINIFDALSADEKERVLAHAQGCESCKKELIASAKLRDALGNLDELDPPLGLASSAIARAKKKSRIPRFAYISVAAAAVIAVAVIASSGLIDFGGENATGDVVEMAVKEQTVRANDEFAAADAPIAEMAEMEPVADQAMAADDIEEDTAEAPAEAMSMDASEEESEDTMAKGDMSFVYVSADKTEFADALDAFFIEFDIYVEYKEFDGNTSMAFFVGALQYERFIELLDQSEIAHDDSLVAGSMVEVTFVK